MNRYAATVLLLITLSIVAIDVLRLPSDVSYFFRPAAEVSNAGGDVYVGRRWAVLIAGSNGYSNYRHQYRWAPEGSARKIEAQKQLAEALSHRMHVDNSIKLVGKLLFGMEKGSEVLKTVRPAGQPLVDYWQCFRTLIRTFETHWIPIQVRVEAHEIHCQLLQRWNPRGADVRGLSTSLCHLS